MSAPYSATDLAVRRTILDTFVRGGVPTRLSVMQALGLEYADVVAAYKRLAEGHVIVPDADSGEVWMAMPFSAVPTEFRVVVGEHSVWANCAWDAFGVAAALGADVAFVTRCPASNAPVRAGVRHGVAFADVGAVAHLEVLPVSTGDHSLAVLRSTGRPQAEVDHDVVAQVVAWMVRAVR